MNQTLLILLVALCFSALFSGLEIAFVSSDKLRFEMDSAQNTFYSRILEKFIRNPNLYISTMLVGHNVSLVIYSTMMARVIDALLPPGLITNEFVMVVITTLVSTLIVIVLGEFVPKIIFRHNPNGKLNFFAVPLYLIYIILYPISDRLPEKYSDCQDVLVSSVSNRGQALSAKGAGWPRRRH
jgi:CBS domain containing-hemolysin-like protein